ncbi:DsbA family protein [Chloroflexota bacterium]
MIPLERAYIRTGKVSYEFKHYVVFSQDSFNVAITSEYAAEQGRFWQYHDHSKKSWYQRDIFTGDSLEEYNRLDKSKCVTYEIGSCRR